MDGLVPLLEAMKTGEVYRDFCIDDAIFHVKKATEALTEGVKDPVAYRKNAEAGTRVLVKMLPLILAYQILESQGESDQTPVESL